jgi:hypothetical protein
MITGPYCTELTSLLIVAQISFRSVATKLLPRFTIGSAEATVELRSKLRVQLPSFACIYSAHLVLLRDSLSSISLSRWLLRTWFAILHLRFVRGHGGECRIEAVCRPLVAARASGDHFLQVADQFSCGVCVDYGWFLHLKIDVVKFGFSGAAGLTRSRLRRLLSKWRRADAGQRNLKVSTYAHCTWKPGPKFLH